MSIKNLPFSAEMIDIICRPTERCYIWQYGIETNGRNKYKSDALTSLWQDMPKLSNGRTTNKVIVKTSDLIDYIQVYDERDKSFLRVPNVDLEGTRGLTRDAYRIVNAIAEEQYKDSPARKARMLAREEIRRMVQELKNSKKKVNKTLSKHLHSKDTNLMNEMGGDTHSVESSATNVVNRLARSRRKTRPLILADKDGAGPKAKAAIRQGRLMFDTVSFSDDSTRR